MVTQKKGYWLYTIIRNGEYKTVVDFSSNPILFLLIEKELGHNTVLLNQLEISKENYYIWVDGLK